MNSCYTFRKSAVDKPQNWELSEQAISCSQEKGINIQIAFQDIQKIRLFYYANNRYRLNNFCCKITTRNQAVFDIYSSTYEGFANFVDQAETYTSFVKELIQKAKSANPNCEIRTGQTSLTYYGNILFVLVAVIFLFLIFSLLPVNYYKFYIFIKIVIIAYFGFYLAKSIKVNQPRQLTGTEIPDNVLPKQSNQKK